MEAKGGLSLGIEHDAQVSPVSVLVSNTMPRFPQSRSQCQTQCPSFPSLGLNVEHDAKNLQHRPSTVVETLVSPVPDAY